MPPRVKVGLTLTAIAVVAFLAIQGADSPSAPVRSVSPGPSATESAVPADDGTFAETRSSPGGTPLPQFNQTLEWPLVVFEAPALWTRTEGAGIKVAVVDTGIDADQPDLAHAVLGSIDLVPRSRGSKPVNSHGTAIAGLIAARGTGPGHMVGLAPQARLIDVRVTDQASDVNASEIAAGITRAVEAGARVINVSLGTPQNNRQLRQALALAGDRGCLVLASAGDGTKPQYPAASGGVLAVAATDRNLVPAISLADYEPAAIYAPGVDLYSTAETGGSGEERDGYIDDISGSDFATAYVSATAALLLSVDPRLSATDARHLLIEAATPVTGTSGPGILNPGATLRESQSVPSSASGPSADTTAEPNPTARPHGTPISADSSGGLGSIEITAIIVLAAGLFITLVVVLLVSSRQGPRPPRRGHQPFSWDESW